jgi:hypothetical protein
MQEIKIVLGGLGLIYILYNFFYIQIDKDNIPDLKPFNCMFCISSWVAILISIWYLDIFYLSCALIFNKINKL